MGSSLSVDRMAKVDAIMAVNPSQRDAETRGVTSSSAAYWLKEEQVVAFEKRARFAFDASNRPDVLYTSVDPAGGGTASDWVLKTVAWINGCIVVSRARQPPARSRACTRS